MQCSRKICMCLVDHATSVRREKLASSGTAKRGCLSEIVQLIEGGDELVGLITILKLLLNEWRAAHS